MEGKRLYVGNLPYSANEAQIRELFAPFGTIESVKLIEQKGFGFVEMGSDDEAQAAISTLNGKDVDGRPLRVSEARPMEGGREGGGPRGGGRGGFGGGRGGFGGPRGGGHR